VGGVRRGLTKFLIDCELCTCGEFLDKCFAFLFANANRLLVFFTGSDGGASGLSLVLMGATSVVQVGSAGYSTQSIGPVSSGPELDEWVVAGVAVEFIIASSGELTGGLLE
jgi:hypothetical protein